MSAIVRVKTRPDMAAVNFMVDSLTDDDIINVHITEPENFRSINIGRDYGTGRFFVASFSKDGKIQFTWLGESSGKRWDNY